VAAHSWEKSEILTVKRTVRVEAAVTKLNNYDLFNYALHSSPNIIRVIKSSQVKMGRTCGTYGGEERCIQGFSGET
jgi:hypothetical protein